MKIKGEIKRLVAQLVYNIFSLFCRKNKIVFLKHSTSSKYKNLYCVYEKINDKDSCVWINNDKLILSSIFNLARAKIVLIDQSSRLISNIRLSNKTTIIQLWHSGGLYKKVGFHAFRVGYDEDEEYKRVKRIHGQIDYFIISDKKLIPYYAASFHIEPDHILPLGLARTDLLYQCNRQNIKEHFFESYPEVKGKKILVYAPTFRTRAGKRCCSYSMLDINFLNKNLGAEWCFAFKLHPTLVNQISIPDGWIDISEYDYADSIMLGDILVTDYSSILFDFALTGNPVFLYLADISEYLSTQRMLYIQPEELVSKSNIAYTENELVAKILNNNNNNSECIVKNYMSACDGKSAVRIVRYIENIYRRKK